MFRLKLREIFASEISEFIGNELFGKDIILYKPVSSMHLEPNSFTYYQRGKEIDFKTIPPDTLFITQDPPPEDDKLSYILSTNPKLDFIKVVREFFIEIESFTIAHSSKIHSDAKIARNVSIGHHCIIGPEVSIGENTQLLNNIIINSKVAIGNNCIIKDNVTIGTEGYDFEIDESGIPIHYPHFGVIDIGSNVWIGSNTTIESAAIEDTIINDFVKIDDLVHIGSGCLIEKKSMITAGVILSRNVVIKENTLIAPNTVIIENKTIGKNCIIGAGSVIINDIDNNLVVAGNPGKLIKINK